MIYDPTTHATEHFMWSEWDPRGLTTPGSTLRDAFHRHANGVLEPMRAHFGTPLHITELGGVRLTSDQQGIWDRALAENGGDVAKTRLHVAMPGNSRHEHGDATDLAEERAGVRAAWIAYLITNPNVGGIGEYPWGLHVDSRPRTDGVIARW